jgi:hypothetical protein
MRKIRKGWAVFEEFPPIFVRLLARERILNSNGKTSAVRVLSDEEIAINSGMDINRIKEVSQQYDWDEVEVGEARQFCLGCNFDLFDWKVRNQAYALATNGSFAYLRSSPDWKNRYKPMLMNFFKNAATSQV